MHRALLLSALPLAVWKCPGGSSSSATSSGAPAGTPELVTTNVHVARDDIRVWNVEATSAVRKGSSTSSEQGTLNVEWSDGTTTSHDATYKVSSETLFQDGKICHNYGPQCYCGTTTFRLESGQTQWKFGIPSNNQPTTCPSGVTPTGDAEIRKTPNPQNMSASEREALKAKIRAEHSAGKGH